jgi:2'-5' RNA ligase
MNKKYGVVFIPRAKSGDFISLADNNKSSVVSYCLGEGSAPHVTICQFFYDAERIYDLWEMLSNQLEQLQMTLTFKTYSNVTFGGDIHWVSLLPEEGKELKNLFSIISAYVKPIRSDQYDPHLTLFNYKSLAKDALGLVENINISDEFDLILGEFDEVGQLVRILRKDR